MSALSAELLLRGLVEMKDKFNYAVGHYYEGDSGTIGRYALFGEVRYGTIHHATGFLEYVKSKSPDKKWKIFELMEMV